MAVSLLSDLITLGLSYLSWIFYFILCPGKMLSLGSVWDETFTTQLDPSEYPISVLVKTQTPFQSRRIGMYDPETGRKIVFDCLGEALRDEHTGEFLAGVLTCKVGILICFLCT